MSILEPGCNVAPHCKVAKERGARTTVGVDIRKVFNAQCDQFIKSDFLKIKPVEAFDFVLMNPPFSQSIEFINHGLAHLKKDGLLICLNRLGLLESSSRVEFWSTANLKALHVFSKRPSFSGDGKTDASAYAYFVFSKRKVHKQKITWI